MQGYIYLNFNDLTQDKKDELWLIAREEVASEITADEREEWGDKIETIIDERVDSKLLQWNREDRFVFNI